MVIKNKTVAIVQARMSSSRLPGKVLMELSEKPVLKHVLDRIVRSARVDSVVVAVTHDMADDVLVEWCEQEGINWYRGDRDDVLSRFYGCAVEHQADNIVRVTSDNPLVDPAVIDDVVNLYLENNADYCANNLKKTFPHGLDVEVITFKALEESYKEAKEHYEREHVTQFVRHRPNRYNICNHSSGGDWHSIRVTLDEEIDLQLIELVIRLIGDEADFIALKKLFTEFPVLMQLNESARTWHSDYNNKNNII